MEAYDLEFDHRISVIDASLADVSDPASPLLAEPIAIKACDECGWRAWCFEQMEATGDLSLLPGMSPVQRRQCCAHGVTTIVELASLDSLTALLIAAGVDLPYFLERARASDPSTPVVDLLSRRPKQAENLVGQGIATAADAARIHPLTATFGDARMTGLPGTSTMRGRGWPVSRLPAAWRRPDRGAPGRHRDRRGHGERGRRLLPLGALLSERRGSVTVASDTSPLCRGTPTPQWGRSRRS